MQHLIAWTSQVAPLADNLGWNENYAGFYYSIDFGFGLINGYKLVKAAIEWENVPEMSSCGIFMPSVRCVLYLIICLFIYIFLSEHESCFDFISIHIIIFYCSG